MLTLIHNINICIFLWEFPGGSEKHIFVCLKSYIIPFLSKNKNITILCFAELWLMFYFIVKSFGLTFSLAFLSVKLLLLSFKKIYLFSQAFI